jgi:hypothetical protein
MKRPNFRNRECPKCGGKIGMIRREEFMNLYGCVGNTHVQVQGTYGYTPEDFPKKAKPLTQKQIDKFIGTIRYPKFAAFAVGKLMAKFKFTREQATAAYKARTV